MNSKPILHQDAITGLKSLINDFIQGRLNDKLEKTKDPQKIEELQESHQPENWLEDASRRVAWIQLVTHADKYHSPDAQGSSIYLETKEKNGFQQFVSTHTLKEKTEDVIGNAAALDIYKFLQIEYENKTILSRILENDPSLREALPGNEKQKDKWLSAFAAIKDSKRHSSSHTLAKQVYFPVNDEYHVLAPLFPTSLAHALFNEIQTVRYSEESKMARIAKKNKNFHPNGCREYTGLAIQNFGGSKPQNISQLNSKRGGKCYLLTSLPPDWKFQFKPPLSLKYFYSSFKYRVRHTIKAFKKNIIPAKYTNLDIQTLSRSYINDICDQLIFFVTQIQSLEPGWSGNAQSKLDKSHAFWLDPGRSNIDLEWGKERNIADWKSEVSDYFAGWLNSILETDKDKFSDDEYYEWKKRLLDRELREIL